MRSGQRPEPPRAGITSAVGSPLRRAYSHRDCELTPPLARSLAAGFTHVEVDVFVLAGRVLIGHDARRLRPGNTLRRLYLEPLRALVSERGGRLFEGGHPLWLHLDVKTAARPALAAARRLLARYPDLVDPRAGPAPVRVMLSGNRPPPAALGDHVLTLDGRSGDLGTFTDAGVMPLISDDWRAHFAWRGAGRAPPEEGRRLAAMVATAHAHGQALRFWGTPDEPGPARERVWAHLLEAGVDLLNTDDVDGLRAFLTAPR